MVKKLQNKLQYLRKIDAASILFHNRKRQIRSKGYEGVVFISLFSDWKLALKLHNFKQIT